MSETIQQLKKIFISDHRVLTRGYRELRKLLDLGDIDGAVQRAKELDQFAGPHIAFEEVHLYPAVAVARGQEYVDRLYEEHRGILSAITDLIAYDITMPPSTQQISEWTKKLEHGLDHAATCGTLLSHIEQAPLDQQEIYLSAIKQFRKSVRSWSQWNARFDEPGVNSVDRV